MLFDSYLEELKKISLLSLDEEQLLWQGYKENGNLSCRRQLIEHYQPLVFKVAMRWRREEALIMDIVQEGTVGLIEAVENYDYSRGVAFSLYAVHRIRGQIINYLGREGSRSLAYLEDAEECNMDTCPVDESAEITRQVEHNYAVEQLRLALQRLPLKEQMVLNGVFLEDREPKQLAENLDLSISHIYRLQKQGIRRVRGMLSKFMQNW
ncbi:MAG: sigma-70 family RNA polymerase sigma factor [Pelosinus sp.]|nr:sigma-70 family RNA polymerase sigma factor [Pelosinus sp.]